MGCDIHMFVEYKPKKDFRHDTKWDSFTTDEINFGRNYELFGYLTDGEVRYDPLMEYGISPRGLPDNISYEVGEHYDPKNYHSYSWLTYEEFCSIIDLMKQSKDEEVYIPIQCYAIIGLMKSLTEVDMNVRLVFWFDS